MEKGITLYDVTGGFECGLINYGSMRDTIGFFNYQFKSGVYILQGECATGGWALSTVLSGKDKGMEGSIIEDNKCLDYKELQKKSCYVGEDASLKKCFGLVPMSVEEQIMYGIKSGLSYSKNVKEIKEKFGLSDERFNRKMKYMSGERWKASMAIGYALGKYIYCFPWMNGKFILKLEDCLKTCIPSLLEIGAIIIIPTTNHKILSNIINDYKVINME